MNTADREDARSTTELISIALENPHDDNDQSVYWDAIGTLRWRATSEVFDAAQCLCESDCPVEQRVGCDILAQLGAPEKPFASAAFSLVVSVLNRADNLDALYSSISALGWLGDLRGVDFVLPYLDHPEEDIRFGVTHALTALCRDKRSIDGLIRLTSDPSVHVRDWATFGLGTQSDVDTPEVRNALFARLNDPDLETRCEALVGLARRKDERVIDPLIRELSGDEVLDIAVEAAGELGDPRCYPALLRLRERYGCEGYMETALRQCARPVLS
jgi:HEAT repeat protein